MKLFRKPQFQIGVHCECYCRAVHDERQFFAWIVDLARNPLGIIDQASVGVRGPLRVGYLYLQLSDTRFVENDPFRVIPEHHAIHSVEYAEHCIVLKVRHVDLTQLHGLMPQIVERLLREIDRPRKLGVVVRYRQRIRLHFL